MSNCQKNNRRMKYTAKPSFSPSQSHVVIALERKYAKKGIL